MGRTVTDITLNLGMGSPTVGVFDKPPFDPPMLTPPIFIILLIVMIIVIFPILLPIGVWRRRGMDMEEEGDTDGEVEIEGIGNC